MTQTKPPQTDAYSMILDAIDSGVYKPGDRLVESELAERFGVSRTPIREALQRLETQSLLERDGRSLIVASLDHNQMAELYVVRRELEGLAARLAARHATVEEVAVLRDMVRSDNRLVKDLNGYSNIEFLDTLHKNFIVENMGKEIYKPDRYHNFSLYLDGTWYSLTPENKCMNDSDPIGCLDVTLLSELVLDPVLNIKDLRKSNRIDFVGGIRGLEELKRRVDSGEMKAAFALYPVSMEQLIKIADTGNIMPPKTTWFEPKLRSGLVIHSLI